jgi:hypothetical protein
MSQKGRFMFKFKQLGVAAAIALIAVSAMASNFRAADQVYLPVVGHITGAAGTFVSDVWISNLSTDPVTVTMIFSSGATGAQNNNLTPIQLLPSERKEFIDFFGTTLGQTGIGQVIFNGCKQGADCGPATQDANGVSPNFRNISVESRIYVGSPTNGQDFAGIPWYNFVSSDQAANNLHRVQVVGIRNTGGVGTNGTYRTNIGLVNASQYSNTSLRVQLFAGNGTQIGTAFSQGLAPLGQVQIGIGAMFPTFTGPTATNAYVIVDQTSSTPTSDAPQSCLPNGCPGFFAYGSQLDNGNSAPTTLEAQYLIPLSDAAILAIYPSGSGKTTQRRSVHH